MASVDTFVFLDNCQMPTGRSYVSRVQVKGREGAEWMTVPIQRAEGQWINAVHFADRSWAKKHLGKMRANYGRCPFFEAVLEIVRPIYEDPGELLAPFNVRLIRALAHYVGLTPRFYLASELKSGSTGTHRLIDIVHDVGGTTYVSGLGGIKYQDPAAFKTAGIDLDVCEYRQIPYQQQGDFVPGLSLLDAVFHVGTEARALLSYTPLTRVETGASQAEHVGTPA